jgi:hypothetical protein
MKIIDGILWILAGLVYAYLIAFAVSFIINKFRKV